MDTHMTHLQPELHDGSSARLPGEPDLEQSVSRSHHGHDSLADPAESAMGHDTQIDGATAAGITPRSTSRGRKHSLLMGVSLGVLVVVAGGVLLLSPFNTVIPVSQPVRLFANDTQHAISGLLASSAPTVSPAPTASTNGRSVEPGSQATASSVAPQRQAAPSVPREPVVAPAAKLAATSLPHHPDSVTVNSYPEQSRDRTLQELVRLGASQPAANASSIGGDTSPKAAQVPSTPSILTTSPHVAEPGSATPPVAAPSRSEPQAQATPPVVQDDHKQPANDITGTVTQAALGQSLPKQAPATTPTETVLPAVQASLSPDVAAPAASAVVRQQEASIGKPPVLVLSVPAGHQEQAEVLQYVTGLTSEITRVRAENEVLRKDVIRRMNEQESRLADYNRRLSVAEARAAMRSAADVGKADDAPSPSPSSASSAKPTMLTVSAPASSTPSPDARAPASSTGKVRYRVQAASPGLALLAEVGRGGGEGAQLQVAVGDQIPGYGVVKSVAQRGPSWVVQTEHGSID